MVGGASVPMDWCRPMFKTSRREIFHTGDLGISAVTKAAHQMAVEGMMIAVVEGMLLVERAGMDPKAFERVVHASISS